MPTIICPSCGTANPEGSQFCQSCDKPLLISSSPTVLSDRAKRTDPPPKPGEGLPPLRASEGLPPPPPLFMGAAVPPPPPPVREDQTVYAGTSIRKLGVRSDGWSDVVEDAAALAEKVRQTFVEEMNDASLEGVHVAESALSSGKMEVRKFQLVYNGKGATVAVRIAPFGKNLAVSWELYTLRTINWVTIGILGGAVFLCTLFSGLVNGVLFVSFFSWFFNLIGTMLSWLLVPWLALPAALPAPVGKPILTPVPIPAPMAVRPTRAAPR